MTFLAPRALAGLCAQTRPQHTKLPTASPGTQRGAAKGHATPAHAQQRAACTVAVCAARGPRKDKTQPSLLPGLCCWTPLCGMQAWLRAPG
jgi:hypothetical protein